MTEKQLREFLQREAEKEGSAAKLARKYGISKKKIYGYLNGKSAITPVLLKKIGYMREWHYRKLP